MEKGGSDLSKLELQYYKRNSRGVISSESIEKGD